MNRAADLALDPAGNEDCCIRLAVKRSRQGFVKLCGFLKACYFDGLRAVLQGRFDRRQGIWIALATMPALLGAGLVTIPILLFPTAGHHAYFEFARILSSEPVAMLPMGLGFITTTLGLKIPVSAPAAL